jgi:uncharacterized cupredoxin-like copper-binding protein
MTWVLRGVAGLAAVVALVVALAGFGVVSWASSVPVVGTPVATGGGVQVIRLEASGMLFTPNAITVRAGQPVQLTLENHGPSVHDVTLADGVAESEKVVVQPGQSGTLTFTFAHPGTYTFVCSQPFHAAAGMKGTITVQ